MPGDETSGMIGGSAQTELASNRTGLAFERTMMGADRTLMAIVRTALSMIGFGFTIAQIFQELAARRLLLHAQTTARHVGLALLALGILLLLMGIVSHARFFSNLKRRRRHLLELRLLHGVTHYNPTPTFVAAALLMALGVAALVSVALHAVR